MDQETRELLHSIKNEMQDFRKETSNRFNAVEEQIKGLKEELHPIKNDIKELKEGQNRLELGQNRLEIGQEEIRTMISELDPKNANRHLELKNSIDELRRDLSTVEIVTASNYADIAKLKRVK